MTTSYRCALCDTPCAPIPDDRDVTAADFVCDTCWLLITDSVWSWENWQGTFMAARIDLHVATLNLKRALREAFRPAAEMMLRKR